MKLHKLIHLQALFLLTGAPLFGNAVIFPVRTMGLLLFWNGTTWLALHTSKTNPQIP
jgi:hypothetical protein